MEQKNKNNSKEFVLLLGAFTYIISEFKKNSEDVKLRAFQNDILKVIGRYCSNKSLENKLDFTQNDIEKLSEEIVESIPSFDSWVENFLMESQNQEHVEKTCSFCIADKGNHT